LLRNTIIALSQNRRLRSFSERSSSGHRLCRRFVAGTSLPEVLKVARTLNSEGMSVTIDSLGESVTSEKDARHSASVYHQLLDLIAASGLSAHVSVKATQMGLDINSNLCFVLFGDLVTHAARVGRFVRIDMEGSPYTQRTLDLVCRLNENPNSHGAVGAVVQAYLYRSDKDITRLVEKGIPIRLCKGAYNEPHTIAFRRKLDVDNQFIKIMKTLLTSGLYHGIATHDPRMIEATITFAELEGISAESFEFQMLYGVRRDLQKALVRRGYRLRIYTPFGTEWYPYFMRRIAERPANVLFVVKNIFRG